MSSGADVGQLCDELKNLQNALRKDRAEAQGVMSRAGFDVKEGDDAFDMVSKLIRKVQGQQSLADGLRERLKSVDFQHREIEVDTAWVVGCPFWRDSGACKARAEYTHCAKHHEEPDERHQLRERPPCRLDEGPILVKKAESEESDGPEKLSGLAAAVEEAHRANGVYLLHCVKEWIDRRREAEQTGGSDGNRGREATTAPCPGGDRSNDPGSPR